MFSLKILVNLDENSILIHMRINAVAFHGRAKLKNPWPKHEPCKVFLQTKSTRFSKEFRVSSFYPEASWESFIISIDLYIRLIASFYMFMTEIAKKTFFI